MTYFPLLQRIGVAILFAVFPAISIQAAAPLTLKATEAPKKQAEEPPKVVSPQPQGTFGVRQVDPLRKDETPQNVEKRPNMFQELLDRPVELPTRRRPPAPPKSTNNTNNTNPFENPFDVAVERDNPFGGGTRNPFEDAEDMDDPFGGNPFGGGSRNPFESTEVRNNSFWGDRFSNSSNPFAAGDPFADEDPRNQGSPQASSRSSASSHRNPLGTSPQQSRQGTSNMSNVPAPPGVGVTFGPPTVIPGGFQSENFDQYIPRGPGR